MREAQAKHRLSKSINLIFKYLRKKIQDILAEITKKVGHFLLKTFTFTGELSYEAFGACKPTPAPSAIQMCSSLPLTAGVS